MAIDYRDVEVNPKRFPKPREEKLEVGMIVKMNPFRLEHAIHYCACDRFEGESKIIKLETSENPKSQRGYVEASNWWYPGDLLIKGIDYV